MPAFPRSVCVFCGARAGTDPAFATAARRTGAMLARNGWRLVYGAGDIGIMGEVAASTQAAGGAALGVIPTHLMRREQARVALTTLIVTSNMHERKQVMFMNSDALVVLPGGAGTLDEFFEVLTWRQIGLHDKPIFLMNINGFWDPLLALIAHVSATGFAGAGLAGLITPVADPATLEAELRLVLADDQP